MHPLFSRTLRNVALAITLARLSHASVQDEWSNPKSPDYYTTFVLGQTYTIKWSSGLESAFPALCPECDATSANLWIMETGSSGSAELQISCKSVEGLKGKCTTNL